VDDPRHLVIITDSKYAQSIVDDWGWAWRERGERKENMDLIDPILDAVDVRRLHFRDNVEVLRVYSHLTTDSKLKLDQFDPNKITEHEFWRDHED
jgi:ribonuclease HI